MVQCFDVRGLPVLSAARSPYIPSQHGEGPVWKLHQVLSIRNVANMWWISLSGSAYSSWKICKKFYYNYIKKMIKTVSKIGIKGTSSNRQICVIRCYDHISET